MNVTKLPAVFSAFSFSGIFVCLLDDFSESVLGLCQSESEECHCSHLASDNNVVTGGYVPNPFASQSSEGGF